MRVGNILILISLCLFFILGYRSIQLYDELQAKKKEAQSLSDSYRKISDSLQKQIEITNLLKHKTDLLFNELRQTATDDASMRKEKLDSFKINSVSITKVNEPSVYKKAVALEREGFEALLNNQFDNALNKFSRAENTLPSYHMVYEISLYLTKSKDKFNDPVMAIQLKKTIVKQYSWGAPSDILSQIRRQIQE